MSDFDKEAERERLREKYERDQRKREASERMSDLLLKGATMTNAHCEDCGDPIFRYEGQEFCPTCQEVVEGEGDPAESAADENGAASDVRDGRTDQAEAAGSTGAGDARGAGGSTSEAGGREGADETAGAASGPDADAGGPGHIEMKRTAGSSGTDAPASESGSTRAGPSGAGSETTAPTSGPEPAPGSDPGAAAREPGSGDDLTAARASLVSTLRQQAARAEACEDPNRARDHLAAAREAAEALSALSY